LEFGVVVVVFNYEPIVGGSPSKETETVNKKNQEGRNFGADTTK
jgi:hypothetical protein